MTWHTVPLGDVIRLKRGYDLPSSNRKPGSIPIISSSGITGFHNEAKIKGPGVVTGRYGTLGEVHYIEEDYWPLNTSLYVEDFKGNIPRYISYLLSIIQIGSQNTAGAVPGVNRNTLHQIAVKTTDKATQKKIVGLISNYDNLISINQRRIALLEEAARRLYREWFVHLRPPGHDFRKATKNTHKTWEKLNLFDLCDIAYGFPFKSSKFNDKGNGTPAIRIRDIPSLLPSTYTTEEVDPSYFIEEGDFLIGMDGIFHMNHWPGPTSYLVQRVCRVRANNKLMQAYIGLALQAPIKNLEASIQGSTVAHLGAKHLKQIEILVPKNQDKELEFLNYQMTQIIQLRKFNKALSQARDLLLPRLMSGKLDVSNIPLPEEVLA